MKKPESSRQLFARAEALIADASQDRSCRGCAPYRGVCKVANRAYFAFVGGTLMGPWPDLSMAAYSRDVLVKVIPGSPDLPANDIPVGDLDDECRMLVIHIMAQKRPALAPALRRLEDADERRVAEMRAEYEAGR